jgi:hypothetical protein
VFVSQFVWSPVTAAKNAEFEWSYFGILMRAESLTFGCHVSDPDYARDEILKRLLRMPPDPKKRTKNGTPKKENPAKSKDVESR